MRWHFGHNLFALGFRPFFLLAAGFAAFQVLHWILVYNGLIEDTGHFQGALQHAHEMIFGYVAAVIVGFLLTAARNWTGIPTASGLALAGLTAVWALGRVAMCGVLPLPPFLAALLDMAFLPAAAIALAVPLLRAGNRRNYPMPMVLLVLAAANAVLHLSALEVIAEGTERALPLAFGVVALLIVLLGGRVVPAFTANALPQAGVKRNQSLDVAALALTAAVPVSDLLGAPLTGLQTALLAAAALVNGLRMVNWKPWATRCVPLLWVLHLGYAWIVVYFLLRALEGLGAEIGPATALHALTAGAIGTMTIGMMSRTSRGHTGRALVASPLETMCFGFVTLAALARVFAPLVWPEAYATAVALSATFWFSAFGIFFLILWPRLTRPRLDGRPG